MKYLCSWEVESIDGFDAGQGASRELNDHATAAAGMLRQVRVGSAQELSRLLPSSSRADRLAARGGQQVRCPQCPGGATRASGTEPRRILQLVQRILSSVAVWWLTISPVFYGLHYTALIVLPGLHWFIDPVNMSLVSFAFYVRFHQWDL